MVPPRARSPVVRARPQEKARVSVARLHSGSCSTRDSRPLPRQGPAALRLGRIRWPGSHAAGALYIRRSIGTSRSTNATSTSHRCSGRRPSTSLPRCSSVTHLLTHPPLTRSRTTLTCSRMAGWTGLEPATSDVTGERSRSAAQGFPETLQRVRATRPDTGRHEKTPSDGPK